MIIKKLASLFLCFIIKGCISERFLFLYITYTGISLNHRGSGRRVGNDSLQLGCVNKLITTHAPKHSLRSTRAQAPDYIKRTIGVFTLFVGLVFLFVYVVKVFTFKMLPRTVRIHTTNYRINTRRIYATLLSWLRTLLLTANRAIQWTMCKLLDVLVLDRVVFRDIASIVIQSRGWL